MVEQLYLELGSRGIPVQIHTWLSTEWFSPDDTPGIAIPFYLAHPDLMRLEAEKMGYAEGEGDQCMPLLRHEAGHVVQNVFALHRRKKWQRLFGLSSIAYPETYLADPNSRDFVNHFNRNYAQSHPAEDWAETFAVWLSSENWRSKYFDWPALKKLEYTDDLMRGVGDIRRLAFPRYELEPLSEFTMTLAEYYEHKQERFGADGEPEGDRIRYAM